MVSHPGRTVALVATRKTARDSARGRYGAGTIHELGEGRWRLTISLGTDPVTGKRRRASKVVHVATKKAAQEELNVFLTEEHGHREAETVGAVIAEYLENAHGMSPTTAPRTRRPSPATSLRTWPACDFAS